MRFDPFSDFDRVTRQLWNMPVGQTQRASFMPVDAYRRDGKFYLHIDLPGVDPDSIDLEVEDNALTITAERKWDREEDEQIILHERPVGTFSRQFFLGEGLDTENIEAGYDHGVLTVVVPVLESAKARKIEVGSSTKALTG
ncbi:MAG: Hsp20/alpha crystallin family protein [Acidimicrobiia bacterium]